MHAYHTSRSEERPQTLPSLGGPNPCSHRARGVRSPSWSVSCDHFNRRATLAASLGSEALKRSQRKLWRNSRRRRCGGAAGDVEDSELCMFVGSHVATSSTGTYGGLCLSQKWCSAIMVCQFAGSFGQKIVKGGRGQSVWKETCSTFLHALLAIIVNHSWRSPTKDL